MKKRNQTRHSSPLRNQNKPPTWNDVYAFASMLASCLIASSHIEAAWATTVAILISRVLYYLLVGE